MVIQAGDGSRFSFDSVYQDIVPGLRIIHAYDMHRDDVHISVSLATVEIEAAGDGTRLGRSPSTACTSTVTTRPSSASTAPTS